MMPIGRKSGSRGSVVLLGVKGGPAVRAGSSLPTASLLTLGRHRIVVDCGLGVTASLVNQGMSLRDLSMIFITHLHSDHYLELGPLLHTAWTAGLKTPVRLAGPSGLSDYWQRFCSSMSFDIDLRIEDEGRPDFRSLVTLTSLNEGLVIETEDLRVSALRNDHPPIEESYALRFDCDGSSVVFSGDTAYFPPLAEFARNADLLVHEAMIVDGVDALCARIPNGDERLKSHILRSHTSAQNAGRIATAAGVSALALHHFVPDGDPDFGLKAWVAAARETWNGPLYIGTDGMRINLAEVS